MNMTMKIHLFVPLFSQVTAYSSVPAAALMRRIRKQKPEEALAGYALQPLVLPHGELFSCENLQTHQHSSRDT